MADRRHPGITMHRLSFGGGLMGLLFAAGSALIFLLGFPTLWYFVALALVLGIAIASWLRVSAQSRSDRRKPLSILALREPESTRKPRKFIQWHRAFRVRSRLAQA